MGRETLLEQGNGKAQATKAGFTAEQMREEGMSRKDALGLLKSGGADMDEVMRYLDMLERKAKGHQAPRTASKGGVTLPGIGKWGVTLYVEQWEALFDSEEAIKAHIREHRDELKTKDESPEEYAKRVVRDADGNIVKVNGKPV